MNPDLPLAGIHALGLKARHWQLGQQVGGEEALAHPLFQHIVGRRTHQTEGEYWAVSQPVRFAP